MSATWSQMYAAHAGSPRPAVVSAHGVWSYSELTERAGGWAAWYDAHDLAPGTTLPALLGSTPSAYALLLAGAFTGRPLAPLSDRLTPTELAACLRELRAPVLLVAEQARGLGRAVADQIGCRLVALPEIPGQRGALPLDAPDDQPALVLHTSGTSGRPKPVRFEQRRLGARVRVYGELLGLADGDIFSSSQQFHHLGGAGLLAVALAVGAAVAPPTTRFTVESWRALGRLGATHATLAPTMMEMLLAHGELHQPTLRLLIYGSSPIRPDTAARVIADFPGLGLFQGYSQTEGGPITALTPVGHRRAVAQAPHLLRSVGQAVPGLELRIDEPDAAGVGEVCARADHLAVSGADGWLHTGDMGRLDGDGYLYLAGRRRDMIIRGGENVYPDEVERRLQTHPAVRDVAVVGQRHEVYGEEVVAFVVPADPAAPPDPDELRAFARLELSGFKVPTSWQLVDELPRGALGKVLRRRLRAAPSPEGTA